MATGGETQVFIYPKTNLKTHCQWLKAKTNGGSNALVSFDSAIIFIKHFYERFSKHATLLRKKMTSLLVFGVNKDQVSARHEIWNSLLHEGGLTSHNFCTQTFLYIKQSLAATSTCTCLALLFTPPSAEAFYQEGWELERFPSPGLWAEDFPPPIAQHRLPIKWTSTQGGDRGRPRRINKTI